MLKKLNDILNIVTGSFAGVFAGRGIYDFWDYKVHPDLYAVQSAPWYTGILVQGIFTTGLLLMVTVTKLIIRKKVRQTEKLPGEKQMQ